MDSGNTQEAEVAVLNNHGNTSAASDKTAAPPADKAGQPCGPLQQTSPSASSSSKAANEDDAAPNFEHIEQAAENLMATLDADADKQPPMAPPQQQQQQQQLAEQSAMGGENAYKWFYRDPQGALQGPFNTAEMAEWFEAGYFAMNLLVKRGCDEVFHPLGELIKRWGCIPFLSAPQKQPPPAKVSEKILYVLCYL